MGAITIKTILCKKVLREIRTGDGAYRKRQSVAMRQVSFSGFLHTLFTDSGEFILKKTGMYAILLPLYCHYYVFVG
jgi:hypothetical protein